MDTHEERTGLTGGHLLDPSQRHDSCMKHVSCGLQNHEGSHPQRDSLAACLGGNTFPVSHINQHPSDSEDDVPTLSKHQTPSVVTSKCQPISTLSFNAPAPQTTSSNINTPAPHKAQNNRMSAITGPATMPAALSCHAPYFSGEGGESLNDFLHEYEELADGHGLTEHQKVD
jgi:hypothetical protein